MLRSHGWPVHTHPAAFNCERSRPRTVSNTLDPAGRGPAIGWLKVPEGKTAKNRVHIDIRVAGEPPWDMAAREILIRAKSAELVNAGAQQVREETWEGQLSHIVMLDPEGNEFCVA